MDPGPDPAPAVQKLADAAPGAWDTAVPEVLALGPAALPTLRAQLAAGGYQPGRQALVAALACLGGTASAPDLVRLVQHRDEQASEAALCLGTAGGPEAIGPLRAAVVDRTADPLLRTAAAASLLDLGEREVAVPFLAAILVAATPVGQESDRSHGLPMRPRWALERHIAIAAIGRACGGNRFGLDPDAPWPRLAAGASKFAAAMQKVERQR